MGGQAQAGDNAYALLKVTPLVTAEGMNAFIQEQWTKLRSDPDYARSIGLDPETLPTGPPVEAKQPTGKIFAADDLIVAIVGGLATEAVAGIWKQFIWPRLVKKFGSNIKIADGRPG